MKVLDSIRKENKVKRDRGESRPLPPQEWTGVYPMDERAGSVEPQGFDTKLI
ncbi:MAG: hypothetical protein LUQ55_04265 [Methanomassiliicoccales archaeon]|nr:hypothetical protein [Methanomassiliicoccales archaeon]